VLLRRLPWVPPECLDVDGVSATYLLFVGDAGVTDISTGELRPPGLALCGVRLPGPMRGVPTPRRETFLGVIGTKSRSFRRSARLGGTTLRGVRGGVTESGEGEREGDVDASPDEGIGVGARVPF
jgi:hypothetical protein